MARKIIIIIVLQVFIVCSVSAQLKKANRLFLRYEYALAIPHYIKVIDKDKKGIEEATTRLADCYRLTSNYEEAENWYAKVVEFDNVEPVNYYYYAQAVRSNGNYERAKELFLIYNKLEPDDERGEYFASFIDKINSWEASDEYEIRNADNINSPFSDFSPIYFKDGIIFSSDRSVLSEGSKEYGWTGAYFLDIFYADYDTIPDLLSFQSPNLFSEKVNIRFHDGAAAVNDSNDVIYFTRVLSKHGTIDSTRYYTNKLKIFYSDKIAGKWSDPKPISLNSEDYSVGHPTFSNDMNTLIFVSDMPGGFGKTDIYISFKNEDGWSTPKNLGSTINTFGDEMFPFYFNDSVLYFSSSGHPGYGGLDVFKSVIVNGVWHEPENLKKPINSPADDFSFISKDNELEGIFSSNRVGGMGGDDIYLAKFYPKPDSAVLSGFVKDLTTFEPIPLATVFLWDKNENKVKILKTDPMGFYFDKVNLGTSFSIKGMKPGYTSDTLNMSIPGSLVDLALNARRDLLLNTIKIDQVFTLENIYYDFDKWNIRPDAAAALDVAVAFLKEHPEIEVELGSHTDSRGSDSYNQVLSERRAQSAVDYIVNDGIDGSKISWKGYGESELVNNCTNGVPCSEYDHQLNRRTEIKVTGIIEASEMVLDDPLEGYQEGDVIDISTFDDNFFNILSDDMYDDVIADINKEQEKVKEEMLKETQIKYVQAEEEEQIIPDEKEIQSETEDIFAGLESFYAVQLAALKTTPTKALFKNIEEVFMCVCDDGYTRVYSGVYKNRNDATPALTNIKGSGFPDAWITTVSKDKCSCNYLIK